LLGRGRGFSTAWLGQTVRLISLLRDNSPAIQGLSI